MSALIWRIPGRLGLRLEAAPGLSDRESIRYFPLSVLPSVDSIIKLTCPMSELELIPCIVRKDYDENRTDDLIDVHPRDLRRLTRQGRVQERPSHIVDRSKLNAIPPPITGAKRSPVQFIDRRDERPPGPTVTFSPKKVETPPLTPEVGPPLNKMDHGPSTPVVGPDLKPDDGAELTKVIEAKQVAGGWWRVYVDGKAITKTNSSKPRHFRKSEAEAVILQLKESKTLDP